MVTLFFPHLAVYSKKKMTKKRSKIVNDLFKVQCLDPIISPTTKGG